MPSGESMCVIRQGQSLRYQVDQSKGVQIVWYANCLIKAAEQVLSDFAIILGYFASNLKGPIHLSTSIYNRRATTEWCSGVIFYYPLQNGASDGGLLTLVL
jgi:hypothetical protein